MAEGTSTLFDSNEQWRLAPSLGGRYMISARGELKHVKRNRLRRIGLSKAGYPETTIRRHDGKGGQRRYNIHILVAEAFLGPRPKGMFINHINGIKSDNRAENLEYVTPQENADHASRTGLLSVFTKLTVGDVIAIRSSSKGYKTLAREFGVSKKVIFQIRKRLTWKHVQ